MSAHAPRTVHFDLPTGVRLVADAHGDPTRPAVVFLHGGGQTRHAWSGAAAAIAARGFYAVTVDHRGHGDSDRSPGGDYTTERFAEDARALAMTFDPPPVLVGASLGGIAALMAEAAGDAPIARAIVLVDVTPRLETAGVRRIVDFMAARPDGFASLEEAADVIASYMPNRPRPKDVSGLAKNLRRGDDGRYRWHWDPSLMKLWNPTRFDPDVARRIHEERLECARRLTIPALLIRGRTSDVVSQEGAREFLETVPHAEYVDLEAAGHMVAGDRNDAFTDAVVDFLVRLPPVA